MSTGIGIYCAREIDYQDSPSQGGASPPFGAFCYFFQPEIIISQLAPAKFMAKNTFFIRASVNTGAAGLYKQNEIDLGSYTNLGSSKPEVLRIHNIQLGITDSTGEAPSMPAQKGASFGWQLCTQSQTDLVLMTDDSFVSGGRGGFLNPDASDVIPPSNAWESAVLPQDYTAGYVIAVPTLFLGGRGGSEWNEDVYLSVMLECTTEPMSKANAVSLAISQQ